MALMSNNLGKIEFKTTEIVGNPSVISFIKEYKISCSTSEDKIYITSESSSSSQFIVGMKATVYIDWNEAKELMLWIKRELFARRLPLE